MKNTKKKATKARAAVKRPKTTAKAATGVRAKAARRTAEGKFTKIIFNQIGGNQYVTPQRCKRIFASANHDGGFYHAGVHRRYFATRPTTLRVKNYR